MGKKRAIMGKLTARGLCALLRAAYKESWDGALRLRCEEESGTIWFVKGQIVHCLYQHRLSKTEGISAFSALLRWTDGEFLLDNGVLPPDRTIRVDTLVLLSRADESLATPLPEADNLSRVFNDLKAQVPGLEFLTLMNGDTLEATTACQDSDREWVNRQLQAHFSGERNSPVKLFFESEDRSLLVIRRGLHATVLAAKSSTSPAEMFWAGEEVERQVVDTSKSH
jgi:hypothetical protein